MDYRMNNCSMPYDNICFFCFHWGIIYIPGGFLEDTLEEGMYTNGEKVEAEEQHSH